MLGGADLVRALSLGGVKSVVVAPPAAAVAYSRAVVAVLEPLDAVTEAEQLVERLLGFARSRGDVPTPLFYDNDWDLLMVSRHRDALGERFRFAIGERELVEQLVDKERFQQLAGRLELPVPAARRVTAGTADADGIDLAFPVVAKPVTRHPESWRPLTQGKALLVNDAGELRSLFERLAGSELELLIQEYIPGPESLIESYHVYVDEGGGTAGEFTGRKIRTYPATHGFSTALAITESPDVRDLGRELTRRLGLTGVAKFDFKRGPDGRLHLLEVNPRFNLWHHPGAVAGVNLPALVYADVMGLPRPVVAKARPGVRWVHMAHDPMAAREAGMSPLRWAVSALRSEAKSGFSWDDPLPLPRAALWRPRNRIRLGTEH